MIMVVEEFPSSSILRVFEVWERKGISGSDTAFQLMWADDEYIGLIRQPRWMTLLL